MLGASRSSICNALAQLREQGAIDTGLASITITSRRTLRSIACDCSDAVHQHFDAVLAGTYPD